MVCTLDAHSSARLTQCDGRDHLSEDVERAHSELPRKRRSALSGPYVQGWYGQHVCRNVERTYSCLAVTQLTEDSLRCTVCYGEGRVLAHLTFSVLGTNPSFDAVRVQTIDNIGLLQESDSTREIMSS